MVSPGLNLQISSLLVLADHFRFDFVSPFCPSAQLRSPMGLAFIFPLLLHVFSSSLLPNLDY